MPAVNPLVDLDLHTFVRGSQGTPDDPETRHLSEHGPQRHLNDTNAMDAGLTNDTNAAGTAENTAMHVAVLVALAAIGVYFLRQTGFRFVVAAGMGK